MKEVDPGWVRVGFIKRAHGIQGEVEIETFDPESEALAKGTLVRVGGEDASKARRVLAVRTTKDSLLVRLEGVFTRNDAEAVRSKTIDVERTSLPKPKPGESYLIDLLGYAVETTGGTPVGELTDMLEGGGPGLLVVVAAATGKRTLVPAVPEIVVRFDHDRRTIVIDPPEGLLDL